MSDFFYPNLIRFGRHFMMQLNDIWFYWLVGVALGSVISVFGKNRLHNLLARYQSREAQAEARPMSNRAGIFGAWPPIGPRSGFIGLIAASVVGLVSPLCMYGTIPVAASFAQKGIREDWLAAFMMSSILLNPQLLIYTAALGPTAMAIRLVVCLFCGIAAGLWVRWFYSGRSFFHFNGLREPTGRDVDQRPLFRLLKTMGRNIKATGPYFLVGIALAALFQTFVSPGSFSGYFGGHSGTGVLIAATLGVPIYICGGGTIPLLQSWLQGGMGLGAATAFMITGPATKITNLGAVKIVLGLKSFIAYLGFILLAALACGLLVNALYF